MSEPTTLNPTEVKARITMVCTALKMLNLLDDTRPTKANRYNNARTVLSKELKELLTEQDRLF